MIEEKLSQRNSNPVDLVIKAVLLVLLIALPLSGMWFFYFQKSSMQEEIKKDLQVIARLQAENINAWQKDQLHHALFTGNPELPDRIRRFIADPSPINRQALIRSFSSLSIQNNYSDILLLSKEGTRLISLTGDLYYLNGFEAVLPVVKREEKPVLVNLHNEKLRSPSQISVICPIYTEKKRGSGKLYILVLPINISPQSYPLVQTWPLRSKSAETLIVQRDGDYAIFLNQLRHHPASRPNPKIPLDQTEDPAVMAVLGQDGFVRGTDYRGIEVAAVIVPLTGTSWSMISKIDIAEASSGLQFRLYMVFALFIGTVLFAMAIGLVLRQREKKIYFRKLYWSEAALRASKERHSIILNAIGDAVIATDTKGYVELLNPAAEVMTGWNQDEAKGRKLEEIFLIVNAQNREKVEDPVSKVLKTGLVIGLANNTLLISRDGKEYQISDSAAPITDPDGKISGVVLVFSDVTKEYQIKKALEESERYYRGLIHSLHEDIIVIDKKYCVTDINSSALKTLSLTRSEAIGRRCYELSHGLDSPCNQTPGACDGCGMSKVFGEGKVCSFQHIHISKSGECRNIDLLCSPLKDENGNVTHMVEAARDVTDLFTAQNELAISEEKYRALFSNAPLPYQYLDETGLILDVNPAWLETLGYSKKEVLGKLFSEFLHPDCRADFETRFDAFKQAVNLRIAEFKVKHKDGHYIDASFNGRIDYHQNGKILQIYLVFEDITEHKQAEENLRRLISAINHTTEAIVVTDKEGAIQYVNPAFEHITGYSKEEVLGGNPRILKSGKHDTIFYTELWQTILSGKTWRSRITNKRKDGSLYVEDAVISPVLDKSGNSINFVAVKRDVTSEIKMEERLRQSQKMEAIGTLAGGIAHDFNNLLFPIIGFSEMLMQDLPPETKEHANVREILKAGKRGGELVNQILAFSRQSERKKMPVRIQQILKEVIKLARSTIPSNISISYNIQQDCGLVLADAIQIHQIAMNLITNAYHAVESNNGSISIQLRQVRLNKNDLIGRPILSGQYNLLSVSDSGHGIDSTVKEKIFEPYFTTKRQGKGTGLGLSTVYGIVKQHNGDITVYSEVGRGATFNVYLPLMAITNRNPEPIDESGNISFGNERIFLVDDDKEIALVEKEMLERLGYKVTTRLSSLEALEAFKASPDAYDLIISDMTMPGLTGDNLSKAIMEIRKDIPVIICTGFSERMDADKAAQIGIQGFLMKPVLFSEMAKTVRKVLESTKSKI